MTQKDFAFRIDRWTDDGERIIEHVAGAEDFQIAMATYHAARKRWPKAAMTLRQDTRVIEDSRRTRIGTLFPFPWSEKGREGGGAGRGRTSAGGLPDKTCWFKVADARNEANKGATIMQLKQLRALSTVVLSYVHRAGQCTNT